ncbi:coniferyl aldehyde dehydrogenase [Novosphingobium flavum]|uniref:Aldehyde dehydrogenase n=1 Tax=Novosphingobium flavum TaxID=1778672 RepID=A0A7X1FT50_9SPHN|nr:coniferyl aldehyde dehydrogenase [Novosphingobium flavum]MBC2666369.1 coniferyl aldehyde dehydrogenase [Novosphingobium flavum]
MTSPTSAPAELIAALVQRQRASFLSAMPEALSVRRDRLQRLRAVLQVHCSAIAEAVEADFGTRSRDFTRLADVLPGVSMVDYCLKNLDRWARPERRKTLKPLSFLGARAEVRYEPKGVIGIVSPWNFPVVLAFAPLAQVLAAGNRALLKPSEHTPETSALFAEILASAFAPEEVAVVTGDAETGRAFAAQKFDHLVFTGATAIGREVARAAAENLVPVTLELGGKSPAIVSRSADLAHAASRIALGKLMNAGQVCLAPDYVLVPEERTDEMIAALETAVRGMYPTMLSNDDYAALIADRHIGRLGALVADAVAKGARATEINPAGEDFSASNAAKLPLTVLRGVNDTMQVMQEEIFGPVLPLVSYRSLDEALAYVNDHETPLGLYWFGEDQAEAERVVARTRSGGVTLNDTIAHVTVDDLPFGGLGASGMGAYHGIEGFKAFSHARAVYRQSRHDIARLIGLKPPYGAKLKQILRLKLGA